MASPTPLKSILKKPSDPSATTSSRNQEVALYHANLLQQRKDVELEILLSTETLIDYPLAAAPYSASNPSPSDIEQFKVILRLFQPSDYDALILERNINERCGYTLCPNNRVTDGKAGRYRIVKMAKDFKVVDRAEVEKWCSQACAKRALYVRVQLSESPAWERENYGGDVELLTEPKSEVEFGEKVGKVELRDAEPDTKKQDAADLALERGDKGLAAKTGLVDIKITEKEAGGIVQPPSLETESLSRRLDTIHLDLEGHTTKIGGATYREDDEDGTDWKI